MYNTDDMLAITVTEGVALLFERTCDACPEQYDVFLDGKMVGYVRLRWSCLTAESPYVFGDTVYEHEFGEGLQGCFDSDEQRNYHLELIAKALYNKYLESETVG
jgi:hypothetical protein